MKQPKTPADVKNLFQQDAVLNDLGHTRHKGSDRKPFYKICHDEEDFAYCVFASDTNIQKIKENIPNISKRKIIIDATFAMLPIGCFKQLLLINIDYMDRVSIQEFIYHSVYV